MMYTYSIAMQRTSQSNPHEQSIFARVRRRSITPHNPLILSNTTFLCLRLRSPPPFISWRHGPDPPPPLLALLSSWPVRSPSRHLAQKVASLQPAYAFRPPLSVAIAPLPSRRGMCGNQFFPTSHVVSVRPSTRHRSLSLPFIFAGSSMECGSWWLAFAGAIPII